MIEILSIEDPSQPEKSPQKISKANQTIKKTKAKKPAHVKRIKAFLADKFDKAKDKASTFKINLPTKKTPPIKLQSPHTSTQHHSATSIHPAHQPHKFRPPAKKTNPTIEKIWNLLQLISTTAVIFAVVFIATNWSSYQVIFEKRVSDFFGLTDNSELVKIASDRKVSQDLPTIGEDTEGSKKAIPDLALEITPPDTRIVIPSINKNVPVIPVSSRNLIQRNWDALEKDIQEALRGGVVHYPGTAIPGEKGNAVITGHSSYFPWDPGRFKDVFALLHDLRLNDRIVVFSNQKKIIYEVTDIKVVLPEQVEVLDQTGEEMITLLTCTPVGTNLKRLIIQAKPV